MASASATGSPRSSTITSARARRAARGPAGGEKAAISSRDSGVVRPEGGGDGVMRVRIYRPPGGLSIVGRRPAASRRRGCYDRGVRRAGGPMSGLFRLKSEFEPKGDQPEAIRRLVEGLGAR